MVRVMCHICYKEFDIPESAFAECGYDEDLDGFRVPVCDDCVDELNKSQED